VIEKLSEFAQKLLAHVRICWRKGLEVNCCRFFTILIGYLQLQYRLRITYNYDIAFHLYIFYFLYYYIFKCTHIFLDFCLKHFESLIFLV